MIKYITGRLNSGFIFGDFAVIFSDSFHKARSLCCHLVGHITLNAGTCSLLAYTF